MKLVDQILNPDKYRKMSYEQQLKDPRWQELRRRVVSNAQGVCASCKSTNKQVQVHHNFYDDRMAWEYEERELRCLCADCHEAFHRQLIIFKRDVLPFMDVRSLAVINGALSVGLKFHKPLVLAHAIAAIASSGKEAARLAYSFEGKP